MHLTDEQILEPDVQSQQHIASCPHCQQRQHNLLDVRQALSTMSELEPDSISWQRLRQSLIEKKVVTVNRNYLTHVLSRLSLPYALAASLILAVGVFFVVDRQQQLMSQEAEIAALIKQNQDLQQVLFSLIKQSEQAELAFALTQYELDKYDEKIQQAYIKSVSKEELSKLWSERVSRLEQLHSKSQQRHLQEI